MRETEKIFINNKFCGYGFKRNHQERVVNRTSTNDTTNTTEIIQKLGQLEDIEDELGIDLNTLFKALKNGCYGIQNGKVYKMKIVRIDSDELNSIILFRNASYGGECYLIKDYGKTWALTKEELGEKLGEK